MNLEYIIQDLKKFFSEHLNINLNIIKDDSLIIDELGADSLSLVELFVHIEDTYGVTLNKRFILKNILSIKNVAEKILFEINKD